LLMILAATTLIQFFYIFGFYNTISIWWENLSESWKQAIIFGVIVAVVIGLIVNFITDKLYAFASYLKERFKSK